MGVFDFLYSDEQLEKERSKYTRSAGYDRLNDFLSSEQYTKPVVDYTLDKIEQLGDKLLGMTPIVFNRMIDQFPISQDEKNAFKATFSLMKQNNPRRPTGPAVRKRSNMAYGTRRKRAYTPRRRAYSKKSRKVYRKKPVSGRRNASNTTMNLIWKAMKSRI